MILWKSDNIDIDKIHSQVSQAYKIPHPEKIQGYGGYFDFCFGEIWVDEKIAEIIKQDSKFVDVLDDLLEKFRLADYGEITEDEKELNFENRYFFGILFDLIGKYQTKYGLVVIKKIDNDRTNITVF